MSDASTGLGRPGWPPTVKPFYRPTLIASAVLALAVMVGSVAPWVSVFMFTVNGLDAGWWGVTTLTLGAVAAVAVALLFLWGFTSLSPRWAVPVAWLVPTSAIICLATALTILIRLMAAPRTDFFGIPIGPGVGWGLWLIVVAAAALCVTSSVVALQIGQTVDAAAPPAPVSAALPWTRSWPLAAAGLALLGVIGVSVGAAVDWEESNPDGGIYPSEMPSFPSYPSFTDEPTTRKRPSSSTPILGAACDEPYAAATSAGGTSVQCRPSGDGFTWQR